MAKRDARSKPSSEPRSTPKPKPTPQRRATARTKAEGSSLEVRPLTSSRLADLEALFGPKGGCGGCWCMWWRFPASVYEKQKGEANHRALRDLVERRRPVGVLGYEGRRAVGWCAVAPRADLPRLDGSRVLAPVDDEPVWSVGCFLIARDARGVGRSVALLEGAVEFAASRGARQIEGYGHDPGPERYSPTFAWTGFAPTFRAAGFEEVARRSPKRPIFRLRVG